MIKCSDPLSNGASCVARRRMKIEGLLPALKDSKSKHQIFYVYNHITFLTHWIPLHNINCAHPGTGPSCSNSMVLYINLDQYYWYRCSGPLYFRPILLVAVSNGLSYNAPKPYHDLLCWCWGIKPPGLGDHCQVWRCGIYFTCQRWLLMLTLGEL